MPKRTPADQALILAVYQETGNAAEVSRRLGLHYNTVIAALRRERGKCLRCEKDVILGRKHCPDCLAVMKERQREKNSERKRLGICGMCDNPIQPPSNRYCADHRINQGSRNRKYVEKRKSSSIGITSDEQRRSYLRWKYGPAAVDCWIETRGRCEVCDRPHSETPVHIHHVDGNHANRTRENFRALCFDCHQLATKLIGNPFASEVVEWVSTLYGKNFPRMSLPVSLPPSIKGWKCSACGALVDKREKSFPLCKECFALVHYLTDWHKDPQSCLTWLLRDNPSIADTFQAALTKP